MGFFGVFDGHGGKAAATFASRHVLPLLQRALNDESGDSQAEVASEASVSAASAVSEGDIGRSSCAEAGAAGAAIELEEVAGLKSEVVAAGVPEAEVAANEASDVMVAAMPAALVEAFTATQRDFFTHTQVRSSSKPSPARATRNAKNAPPSNQM